MSRQTTLVSFVRLCNDAYTMKQFADQMADFDKRREAALVSYRYLAKRTGIQPANLSRYKTGAAEPTLSQWIKLNNALDAIIAERTQTLQALA